MAHLVCLQRGLKLASLNTPLKAEIARKTLLSNGMKHNFEYILYICPKQITQS